MKNNASWLWIGDFYFKYYIIEGMKWRKSPVELINFLVEITRGINCQSRKMFGYPAYFINNNMFICAFQESLIIRLSEKDKTKLLKQYKNVTEFEPIIGRAMKQYIVIPESLYKDKIEFTKILNMSVKYVSSLPPKVKDKKLNTQI